MDLACLFLIDALHTRGYCVKTINGEEIDFDKATKMAACELLPDNPWPMTDCCVHDILTSSETVWYLVPHETRAVIEEIRKKRRECLANFYEDDWRSSCWGLTLGMKPELVMKVFDSQVNLETANKIKDSVDIALYKTITAQARNLLKSFDVELWPTKQLMCTPLCHSMSPPCQLVNVEELEKLKVDKDCTAQLSIERPISKFLNLPLNTIVKTYIVFPGNPGIWHYQRVTMTK